MTPTLTYFPGYPSGERRPLMRPEGRGTSRILLMGEALGDQEEQEQLPFRPHAEAGSVLERALVRAGLNRDQLTLTNLVWYRPPNNWLDGSPWEMEAIRTCQRFNDQLVAQVQPRVIVALGGLPYRELTGLSGRKQGIASCRGMITPGLQYPGIPVVGTYHPSFLRRGSKERQKEAGGTKSKVVAAGGGTAGMALLGTLIRDLQLAKLIAAKGAPEWKPKQYRYHATLDDWKEVCALSRRDRSLVVSYDFETRDSIETDDESEVEHKRREITQAQVCVGSTVVVSAWTNEILPLLRDLLESQGPKLDWNGREFDRPILRELGIRTDLGEWIDGMDLWHYAQPDLPRGLQYAASFFCPEVGPWKHLSGSEPHYYGALDVDVPTRIYEGLQGYMKGMRDTRSGRSLWEGYHEQVLRLAPCLDHMTATGIPVDDVARLELEKSFTATQKEISDRLQELVPDEIKDCDPKEGLKRKSKIPQECLEAAGQGALFGEPAPLGTKIVARDGCCYIQRSFRDKKADGGLAVRWARLVPFTPNGSNQMLRYLRYKGYEIPEDYKTGKESTGEDGLRRLAKKTGDPVIPLALDYREVGKAKGTYVDGWRPDQDGRVHPHFTFKPATGQLSSWGPNAQNFPQHDKIARALRRIVKARPGHSILKFDYRSFHVLTTGFEAQDPRYMRMARLDMHSFFALCGLLRLEPSEKVEELPDEELTLKLKWYRKQPKQYSQFGGQTFQEVRDQKAKRAILGIGFGQGARSLYMLNPESYASIAEAQRCLDMLDVLFPAPGRWRTAVRLEADKQTYLTTRYGYIRRFWDVFQRRPVPPYYQPKRGEFVSEGSDGRKWLLKNGDDAEACIAFRPANDAFGLIRERMVRIYEMGLADKYNLMLNLHDDLTFECPDSYVEQASVEIKNILERPSDVLTDSVVAPQGLWCEVEASVGKNWDARANDNPEGMRKLQ